MRGGEGEGERGLSTHRQLVLTVIRELPAASIRYALIKYSYNLKTKVSRSLIQLKSNQSIKH